jgi:hypothetical protein
VRFHDVTLGLSRGHSANLGESSDEMMERLTYIDRQRKELAQQARLAETQAEECTFKPQINENSRKMARVRSSISSCFSSPSPEVLLQVD